MHRTLGFLAIAASLTLSACASANVESTFTSSYDRALTNVLVVTEFGVPGGPYESAFVGALTERLESRGLTVTVRRRASSGPDTTPSDAASVGASAVLAVRETGASVRTVAPGTGPAGMGMGISSETELEAILTDLEVRAIVWTADITSWRGNSSPQSEARKAAAELVATLAEDGLLPEVGG